MTRVEKLEKALDEINTLVCYVGTEDPAAHEQAMHSIGEIARTALRQETEAEIFPKLPELADNAKRIDW